MPLSPDIQSPFQVNKRITTHLTALSTTSSGCTKSGYPYHVFSVVVCYCLYIYFFGRNKLFVDVVCGIVQYILL